VAHESYEALLADRSINAVYNPLPNALHAEWTLAALDAGKHVLCEKPLTANTYEARAVATAARVSGLVVMEAFHYRYHPMAKRMYEIVASGELGKIQHVEASLCFPLPRFADIRYDYDLAGGATMDAGCYPVHIVRMLGGEEPEVVSAKATLRTPDIDRAMTAELRFPSGHSGRVTCSMWSKNLLRMSARVVGEAGVLTALNPFMPQLFHRLTVRTDGHRRVEHFDRRPTYAYQLDSFVDAVLRGEPTLTPPADAVANMTVIDGIYAKAGLRLRSV
jgi:predicted dehydrogenase